MKKKIAAIIAALMVTTVGLTACGDNAGNNTGNNAGNNGENNTGDVEESGEADASATIVVGQGADAVTLDIHNTNDQPSSRVGVQIYETLVDTDEDNNIVPALAESWEEVDETTTRFFLEEGVMFHNGEELKASDVKFTIERMIESPTVAHIAGPIVEVNVVDEYTVDVVTETAFGPLLYHLAHPSSAILNEVAVTEAGEEYGTEVIVGTGPFVFDNWVAGDSITLVRNEEYRGEPAQLAGVEFRAVPEAANLTIGLQTGELDIAYDVLPLDKARIVDDSNLTLLDEPSFSTNYVHINTEKIQEVEVRQALNYAVNKDDIIMAVFEGSGEVATAPIAPSVFGHNPELTGYEYDPEKAIELLAEAGYDESNPLKINIMTNESDTRVQIAEIMQEQYRQVGIEATVDIMEWGAYLDAAGEGRHDLAILGWTAVTGDADYGLKALYHGDSTASAGNRSFYSNDEVSELLDIGATSTDSAEREDAYFRAQEIIMEEAPMVWTHFATQNAGFQNSVKGFELKAAGHHRLYPVYVAE